MLKVKQRSFTPGMQQSRDTQLKRQAISVEWPDYMSRGDFTTLCHHTNSQAKLWPSRKAYHLQTGGVQSVKQLLRKNIKVPFKYG